MKLEDLKHASKTVKLLNPDIFNPSPLGGLVPNINKPQPRRALVKDVSPRKRSRQGVVYRVVLISFRRKLVDEHDNLRHGMKPLVDCVAQTLGVDDADPRVEWNYSQVKTDGKQGTVVMIERV